MDNTVPGGVRSMEMRAAGEAFGAVESALDAADVPSFQLYGRML